MPLHTWLPDAHVEAPTAGSVILAGVLLKMGTYGFMKLGFPLFPDATRLFAPVIGTLAVVSIIYGACLALVQTDIKKIIAYSSISHLGYVMLGLISLDLIGIQGAMMQMVSHGLIAGGLFLMVGMIYERCHTPRARRVRRARQAAAGLLGVLRDPDAGLDRAADDQRLHRRVPGPAGRVQRGVAAVRRSGATYPLVARASARSPASCSARCTCCGSRSASCSASRRRRTCRSSTSTLREKAILATIVVAVFALGLFPDEPMRKTELAARQYQQLVAEQRTGRRSPPPAASCRRRPSADPAATRTIIGDAMNWLDIAVAMLPENLLLAGIVVLIALEIVAPRRQRGALPLSLRRRDARRRGRGAGSPSTASRSTPFPGHFSVRPPALLAKAIVLALAVPVLLIVARRVRASAQFHILLLSSLYGVCLLLSADSFLTLFLGLELMSLPVYVLVAARLPAAARAPRRRSSTWCWAAPRRRRC